MLRFYVVFARLVSTNVLLGSEIEILRSHDPTRPSRKLLPRRCQILSKSLGNTLNQRRRQRQGQSSA